jgi:DNA-binding IscR family transcriptional regulator
LLKEHVTVDYACRIAGILAERSGPTPAGDIVQYIDASQSYVCKVLSRMTRAKLLKSGVDGYELAKPLNQLTVRDVLAVCHPGLDSGPAAVVSDKLRELAQTIPLQDVL